MWVNIDAFGGRGGECGGLLLGGCGWAGGSAGSWEKRCVGRGWGRSTRLFCLSGVRDVSETVETPFWKTRSKRNTLCKPRSRGAWFLHSNLGFLEAQSTAQSRTPSTQSTQATSPPSHLCITIDLHSIYLSIHLPPPPITPPSPPPIYSYPRSRGSHSPPSRPSTHDTCPVAPTSTSVALNQPIPSPLPYFCARPAHAMYVHTRGGGDATPALWEKINEQGLGGDGWYICMRWDGSGKKDIRSATLETKEELKGID